MPTIIDRYQPIFNWRWDVNTLAWVVWDGATTGGGGGGGTVAQGAAGASAWPVSGTFFQATQPVSLAIAPTTPVTGTFFQATQPVSLASAPTTPVTGTFFQATQPVSLAVAPTTPVTGTFFQTTQPVSLAVAPITPVTGTFFQATQPVSLASVVAPGTTSVGQVGTVISGIVSSNQQPFSTDTVQAVSLTVDGALRVDASVARTRRLQEQQSFQDTQIGLASLLVAERASTNNYGWEFR